MFFVDIVRAAGNGSQVIASIAPSKPHSSLLAGSLADDSFSCKIDKAHQSITLNRYNYRDPSKQSELLSLCSRPRSILTLAMLREYQREPFVAAYCAATTAVSQTAIIRVNSPYSPHQSLRVQTKDKTFEIRSASELNKLLSLHDIAPIDIDKLNQKTHLMRQLIEKNDLLNSERNYLSVIKPSRHKFYRPQPEHLARNAADRARWLSASGELLSRPRSKEELKTLPDVSQDIIQSAPNALTTAFAEHFLSGAWRPAFNALQALTESADYIELRNHNVVPNQMHFDLMRGCWSDTTSAARMRQMCRAFSACTQIEKIAQPTSKTPLAALTQAAKQAILAVEPYADRLYLVSAQLAAMQARRTAINLKELKDDTSLESDALRDKHFDCIHSIDDCYPELHALSIVQAALAPKLSDEIELEEFGL